jgi:hypothetical protein
LYEEFAAKALAAGNAPSSDFVLMEAAVGETRYSVPTGSEHNTTVSPFGQPRKRSSARFSTRPRALDIDALQKPLDDYLWMPMTQNNPLFDAFIIEFKHSAQTIDAVVWILQMTLSADHGGSSGSYELIKLIKAKAKEALFRKQLEAKVKVGGVTVKYVLVSPIRGRWKLPEKNWKSYEGDVYYQCVKIPWYVVACYVCPGN